jgi:hypothetical protein
MIMGLGDLGGQVLQLLCNTAVPMKIVTADIDEENGYRKTNLVQYMASQMGFDRELEFVKIDLYNIEETAETFSRIDPDIIYSAATLQSWWVINTLPQELFEKLDRARFGPWLPMHLTLVHKLMQAVKESGRKPLIVNSSFPDVTHPVLSKIGLSPDCGIGNIHNIIQPIRKSVADLLNVPVKAVSIFLYLAHFVSHYIPRFGDPGGAPYFLKILVDGRDMSNSMNHDEIFAALPRSRRRSGGQAGQILTAASAAAIIKAILTDSNELLHAPGPNGLPGGYPCRVGDQGAHVVLPEGIDMKKAIRINEGGNKYDGIEAILEDGTTVFTDKELLIMREMLGYDCKRMKIEESEERARELGERFKGFTSKLI